MFWLIIFSWLIVGIITTSLIYFSWKKECPSEHTIGDLANYSDVFLLLSWIPLANISFAFVIVIAAIMKSISKIKIK